MNEESVPNRVEVYELNASATMEILYKYIEVLQSMAIRPRIVIIRFKQILQIDSVGARVLNEAIKRFAGKKVTVLFSDVNNTVKNQLENNFLVYQIGEENIFSTLKDALGRAEKLVQNQG